MLRISNLGITFNQYDRGLHRKQLTVITDLDLTVQAGELVAVVGASGSGKSLLAHALLGILPENAQLSGAMEFQGQPLTPKRCEALRGKAIALTPQSVGYLDPLMTVGRQVQRVGQLNGLPARSARTLMQRPFTRYDLPAYTPNRYPFQLAGGMARRVLVSTAVVTQAQLVIADEPTPGLHPDVV
jgi:peptide/nickel transport system ATP-binding protein